MTNEDGSRITFIDIGHAFRVNRTYKMHLRTLSWQNEIHPVQLRKKTLLYTKYKLPKARNQGFETLPTTSES